MLDPQRPVLPIGFRAVCIIALILGSMGACMSMLTASSLLMASAQQNLVNNLARSQPNDASLRHQQQLMQESMRVQAKWRVANITSTLTGLIASFAFALGGGMSLTRKAVGPTILIGATVARAATDIAQLIVALLAQKDTQALLARIADTPGTPQPTLFKEALGAFGTIAIVVGAGWIAIKLVFYVIAILQARKPEVRALMS